MGAAAWVGVVLTMTGCPPKPTGPVVVDEPAVSMAEAMAIVRRHNANAAKIEVVWCRLGMRLAWQEEGQTRRESGDGVLVFRKPGELALTVGKLGQEGLWAGGDGRRYWLFDLREDVAWIGSESGGVRQRGGGVPLAVQPGEVARLMGWSPIDEASVARGRVVSLGGRVMVEPVDTAGRPTGRWVFDPEVVGPVRVDVLAWDGSTAVSSRLADPVRVRVSTAASAVIMTDVEVRVSDGSASMDLNVRNIETDGARVRDAAFDLDRLMAAHKPDEVIDLDVR
jgi:hypothetical protein